VLYHLSPSTRTFRLDIFKKGSYQLARIAEVLSLKGLRAGMNKTQIEWASRLMTNWQNFIFLS
jgi:hypothetical protein